jgi:hypothetical protein
MLDSYDLAGGGNPTELKTADNPPSVQISRLSWAIMGKGRQ